MNTLLIREATASDVPAISRLMAELGHPDSEEEIRKRFEIISSSAPHKIIVAQLNDAVVGLMTFHVLDLLLTGGKWGRITALVVTEAQRGKGIGKELVAKAEELARRSQCKRLELTSNNKRIDAHKFYESVGFDGYAKRFVKVIE